jgi:hypothetical protein
MTGCKHTSWVRLSRQDQGFALEVSDRAQRLLDGLPKPDNQFPSIIALVGNQSKLRLLNRLGVTAPGPRGRRGHGEIHMFVTPSSAHTDCPILIADGDIPPQNRLGRQWKPQQCHEVSVRPFRAPTRGKIAEIADHIYHRLVLPFADIICFFATDLGGIEQVVYHLALWMDKGPASMTKLRPWLVIVVDDGIEDDVLATFRDLMRAETSIDVMHCFEDIRLISLAKTKKRRRARRGSPWSKLSCELLSVSRLARQTRLDTSYLFSARHLAGFLQHATVCATEALQQPFNFIRASRIDKPVAVDLEDHLSRFSNFVESIDDLKGFALPMIASSLILDHYPPGMHRRS